MDKILSEQQISAQMRCSKAAMDQAIAKLLTGWPLYRQEKDWKTTNHHCTRGPHHEEDSYEVTHKFNEENRTDLLRRSCSVRRMFMFKRLSKEFNFKSHKPAKNLFIELMGNLITILLVVLSCYDDSSSSSLFLVGIGAILLTVCKRLVHCCFTTPHLSRYLLFR